MKLRVCLLAIVFCLTVSVCGAEEPQIKTEERFRATFEELWQDGIDKKLVNEEKKPKVFIMNLGKRVAAAAYSNAIVFDRTVVFDDPDTQIVIVAHEIGHLILGHTTTSFFWRQDDEVILLSEDKQTQANSKSPVYTECEADIFAADLISSERVLRILRRAEALSRQTKKEKILSLFLSPLIGAVDVFRMLRYQKSDFFSPLSKYRRLHRIHGLAHEKAILVLEGKRQSCGE
ncbi:MAG: hypothetical protein AAB897_03450 [Patescibacteria group bacterium]